MVRFVCLTLQKHKELRSRRQKQYHKEEQILLITAESGKILNKSIKMLHSNAEMT